MIREVVRIDEELCNGCGDCVTGCHEGALQVIDGKARLISDLMCDGLGACIGHCPQGAITVEKREAEPYNETRVMESMMKKGKNTVIAHLKHLKEHNETTLLREGVNYLREHEHELDFELRDVIHAVHGSPVQGTGHGHSPAGGGGCPGSRAMTIERAAAPAAAFTLADTGALPSELRQWPVQLHLVNPQAPQFRDADVLLAADCTAYAMGDFHPHYLKGKALAIACPKLDENKDVYVNKITAMIDNSNINTLTVMIMQVPCCGGLLQIARTAASAARRNIPIKLIVVGIDGRVAGD